MEQSSWFTTFVNARKVRCSTVHCSRLAVWVFTPSRELVFCEGCVGADAIDAEDHVARFVNTESRGKASMPGHLVIAVRVSLMDRLPERLVKRAHQD